jgi:hypothetical protein
MMGVVLFNQCSAFFDGSFTISARNGEPVLVRTERTFPKGKKSFRGAVDAD